MCVSDVTTSPQLQEVEAALAGKREQVEELKRAMMSENLEALSLTPPDTRPSALAPTTAHNAGGTRAGGACTGGTRAGGACAGETRAGGARKGGTRAGGARVGGAREGGARAGGACAGGAGV